jgi:hypothetical protein
MLLSPMHENVFIIISPVLNLPENKNKRLRANGNVCVWTLSLTNNGELKHQNELAHQNQSVVVVDVCA